MSSETTTLPTPPQSLVHQEGTHHGMTECPAEHSDSQGTQGKPQRLTSDISNTPSPSHICHSRRLTVLSVYSVPRLDLPTFSGDALEWQPFGMDLMLQSTQIHQSKMSRN